MEFNVIKRNGEVVPVQFDEISRRNEQLVKTLGLKVNVARLTQTVTQGLKNNISTVEIDHLSSETAASLSVYEPEYDILAARIFMDNLHKSTPPTFYEAMQSIRDILHEKVLSFLEVNRDTIEASIVHDRDFQYSYFACKTLVKSYLLQNGKRQTVERPQYMIMRVAIGIHYNGTVEDVIETYNLMSQLLFTHASPTLFNGGTTHPQLSSCFLLGMEDSLDGIYTKLHETAMISKHGGGIGINISNIRSKGSKIHSTNGVSDGIIPMIKVFNETARYVNQSGKRKGSIAMYLEPWHPETLDFLDLRLNAGSEELRARDIFTALWIPDLFMKRVKSQSTWSFFDPYTVKKRFGKGLQDVYGEEFEQLYIRAEEEGIATKTLPAQEVWTRVLRSEIETGTPYLLYKDAVNQKSNQSNIGIIRGSNLCAEILEYTDNEHTSVCNLASVALNMFVREDKSYDYSKLGHVVRVMVRNLNRIIDNNFYPSSKAEKTNRSHRPIGMGVQGLNDVFCLMGLPWDSEEAKDVNRRIAETMYYYAMDESAELAQRFGSYDCFEGSPASKGILQPDMWGVQPMTDYDWEGLRAKVRSGLRNSLLLSLMPTASTSQMLGNTEAFEPATSNIYTRKVLAGDFPVVNKHLYRVLSEKGMWTKSMVDSIIRDNGSIQNIDSIPADIKKLFRTVWELSMKTVIDLAAERAPFVDQTQSMNLFMATPTNSKLSSMHFYAWEKGLKTGCYYLRSKPRVEAVKFSLMEDSIDKRFKPVAAQAAQNEVCESCSA
jgi:ribonucleoside-diphosphate reductase alpha subunit